MNTTPHNVMIACDNAIMAMMRRAGLSDDKAHELVKVIWHELADKMNAQLTQKEIDAFELGKRDGFRAGLNASKRQGIA